MFLCQFNMAALQISVQDRAIEAFKRDLENDVRQELVDAMSLEPFKSLMHNAQTSQNTLNLAIVPTGKLTAFNYYDAKGLASAFISYIDKLYSRVNDKNSTVPLENFFMATWLDPLNRRPLREIYTYRYTFEKEADNRVKNVFTYLETYTNLYLFTLNFCDQALVPALISKLERITLMLGLQQKYEEVIALSRAVLIFNKNKNIISRNLFETFDVSLASARAHLESQRIYRASHAPTTSGELPSSSTYTSNAHCKIEIKAWLLRMY